MSTPIRVLLLEDSTEDAELILYTLRKSGFEPDWRRVETENEFLWHLEWLPDVVLADFNLPQTNAERALELLKDKRPDIPFIVVSGAIGEDIAVRLVKQGAADYLLKDRLTRLGMAVTHAMEERRTREQKRAAEAAMREREAEWHVFVDSAPFGVVRWDINADKLLAVNPALVRMLRYDSKSELQERLVSREIYNDPADHSYIQALTSKEPRSFSGAEAVWKCKDGRLLTVRLSGHAVKAERGAGHVMETIVEDISERRALERQLEQSRKLEAVGRLAGGVAHDFNNLLGIIIGNGEILARDLNPSHYLHRKAKAIVGASEEAAALVSQLLAMGRKQPLAPKLVDLNSLVSDSEPLVRELLRSDIELKIRFGEGLGPVRVDPVKMRQILIDLAANSRDALAGAGAISIETDSIDFESYTKRWGVAIQAGRYVKLAVTDTGVGMDEEVLAHLFEPFFTTKPSGSASGLGLAAVYGTVKQSGGYVCVFSKPGLGTTMEIYLPRAQDVIEVAAVQPLPFEQAENVKTILLVEDALALRDLLREALQSNGYRVLLAGNGEEAIRAVEQHGGQVDLVVTDVIMPRMTGPQMAAKLKAQRPDTKVLFMSGYADGLLVDSGIMGPNRPFLQKPFPSAHLLYKVSQMLSGTEDAPDTSAA